VPGLRLVAAATGATDPRRLGLGAVEAMNAVRKHGVPESPESPESPDGPDGPEITEFTEAFAGQTLACLDATGTDESSVNRDGGAIALGHPWGASGAVLVVRLFSQLVRERAARTGLTALSAAGGLGVAASWEVVE
jgi:acetyl-CoA C-acetyltransferase